MPSHAVMVEAVERYVEAFEKGDPEMVVALYSADATVEDPIGTPIHAGHDAIREFYTHSMTMGPKLKLQGPVRTGGDYAAFAFSVELDYGGRKSIDVIDTFKFDEEGKVVEMRAFWGQANMQGFEA